LLLGTSPLITAVRPGRAGPGTMACRADALVARPAGQAGMCLLVMNSVCCPIDLEHMAHRSVCSDDDDALRDRYNPHYIPRSWTSSRAHASLHHAPPGRIFTPPSVGRNKSYSYGASLTLIIVDCFRRNQPAAQSIKMSREKSTQQL